MQKVLQAYRSSLNCRASNVFYINFTYLIIFSIISFIYRNFAHFNFSFLFFFFAPKHHLALSLSLSQLSSVDDFRRFLTRKPESKQLQIDHPQQQSKNVYRSVVSIQRKRAVIACFRQTSLHSLPRLRPKAIYIYSIN